MAKRPPIHSLALTTYFKNPSFGMKNHEILSRATAFLLSVDPPSPSTTSEQQSIHSHILRSQSRREERDRQRNYKYEPAGGPQRDVKELGWLEFCPSHFRPLVHVVCSSHVIAPWKWPQYYEQDWVKQVQPEHCSYTVDVYGPASSESMAKLALNPYPIHHPAGLDMALMHLKQEETSLKQLGNLGVKPLYLRDIQDEFQKGEELRFEGFEIMEMDASEQLDVPSFDDSDDEDEDTRIFVPYSTTGSLLYSSPTRYLATTPTPLPQGLCGGPTLDSSSSVCGLVEGIVPPTHDDASLAGAAAFIPLHLLREFINAAEEFMLKQIIPDELFERVCALKAGKKLNERTLNLMDTFDPSMENEQQNLHETEQSIEAVIKEMKKYYTTEQIDGILDTVRKEGKEVLDILKKEGGDIDEVVARVRQKSQGEEMVPNLRSEEDVERFLKRVVVDEKMKREAVEERFGDGEVVQEAEILDGGDKRS